MKPACIRFPSGGVVVVAGLAMDGPGATPLRAQAQAPERLPSFEVASVKENTSCDSRARMQTQPGGRSVDVVVIDSGKRPTLD